MPAHGALPPGPLCCCRRPLTWPGGSDLRLGLREADELWGVTVGPVDDAPSPRPSSTEPRGPQGTDRPCQSQFSSWDSPGYRLPKSTMCPFAPVTGWPSEGTQAKLRASQAPEHDGNVAVPGPASTRSPSGPHEWNHPVERLSGPRGLRLGWPPASSASDDLPALAAECPQQGPPHPFPIGMARRHAAGQGGSSYLDSLLPPRTASEGLSPSSLVPHPVPRCLCFV